MKIFKYKVIDDDKILSIPEGFNIVTAGFQNDALCLWIEVDPEAPKQEVGFTIVGTGQEIPKESKHLYTWTTGLFVFHLYMHD